MAVHTRPKTRVAPTTVNASAASGITIHVAVDESRPLAGTTPARHSHMKTPTPRNGSPKSDSHPPPWRNSTRYGVT